MAGGGLDDDEREGPALVAVGGQAGGLLVLAVQGEVPLRPDRFERLEERPVGQEYLEQGRTVTGFDPADRDAFPR